MNEIEIKKIKDKKYRIYSLWILIASTWGKDVMNSFWIKAALDAPSTEIKEIIRDTSSKTSLFIFSWTTIFSFSSSGATPGRGGVVEPAVIFAVGVTVNAPAVSSIEIVLEVKPDSSKLMGTSLLLPTSGFKKLPEELMERSVPVKLRPDRVPHLY